MKVNSVPRFENAWMQRSKFPYTARSSAKVIRHAVSIDERRAKFRQDLISETKTSRPNEECHRRCQSHNPEAEGNRTKSGSKPSPVSTDRFRRRSQYRPRGGNQTRTRSRTNNVDEEHLDPRRNTQTRTRSASPAIHIAPELGGDGSSIRTTTSINSYAPANHPDDDQDDDETSAQDIKELWFPGKFF